MRFLFQMVFVALSLFVLSACGGGGSAGSDNPSALTSGASGAGTSNDANSATGDSNDNGTTSDSGNA